MALTKEEEKILRSIKIPSENNPNKPEFPPGNPKFPASPTYKINVSGFSDVWLKDESVNPTGTHKDRMAWEMVVTYRQMIVAKKQGIIKSLPSLSILSSGSAAFAIQTQLRKYKLPNLHVLIDSNADPKILKNLELIGCKIFLKDLGRTVFSWKDILNLTKNPNGFDITSNEAYDPTVRFYDWMSYEIINSNADFVFIPFGTGQLYENVLNIVKKEICYSVKDPRFLGDKKILKNTSFLGATTSNPRSKADKLFAPFLPFTNYSQQWIRYYKHTGMTGKNSDVYQIQEKHLDKAIEIAKAQGISCEPSGIAGLALMLQMRSKLPNNMKMLIVNTGKTKYIQ
ncbi:pyridoxal-phosphate dependent enzyme [Candidatus Woesearchaeota archaeon]|nr:pyridoxal-phosphate dependent enzyme [Candidatus Woesearchaeota archaeon]